ncbi:hypothetical protein Ancab_015466 [Ancistrocladus abbreviatus]
MWCGRLNFVDPFPAVLPGLLTRDSPLEGALSLFVQAPPTEHSSHAVGGPLNLDYSNHSRQQHGNSVNFCGPLLPPGKPLVRPSSSFWKAFSECLQLLSSDDNDDGGGVASFLSYCWMPSSPLSIAQTSSTSKWSSLAVAWKEEPMAYCSPQQPNLRDYPYCNPGPMIIWWDFPTFRSIKFWFSWRLTASCEKHKLSSSAIANWFSILFPNFRSVRGLELQYLIGERKFLTASRYNFCGLNSSLLLVQLPIFYC